MCTQAETHIDACTHTAGGEIGSSLTLHDWSLFPSLSLPAEIVLTKEKGDGGGGVACLGEGMRALLCCHQARESEGGEGGELEGERGSVGEKDRIPEEAQTHWHTHTHTHMHTYAKRESERPSVTICGVVDYFPNWNTHRANPGMVRSVTIYSLIRKKKILVSLQQ